LVVPHIAEQPTPIRAFLEVVLKWVDEIDKGGLADAHFQSDQLKATGLMLAHDPEFRRIFMENRDTCNDDSPEHVLNCIYAFFRALNDAALSGRYRESSRRMGNGEVKVES
jgi:hypothetical protein